MPVASPKDEALTEAATHVNTSVDMVARLIREELARSCYAAIRRLKCEAHGGTMSVTGQLPTFHLKQLVIAAVTRCLPEHIALDYYVDVIPLERRRVIGVVKL